MIVVIGLVIDTDIAHRASEITNTEIANNCLQVLSLIMAADSQYRAIMSDDLYREWSDFSEPVNVWRIKWLAQLEAAGKIVILEVKDYVNPELRAVVKTYDIQKQITRPDRKCEKDVHLLEAALVTDHRIIAIEDRVRNHFKFIAASQKALQEILWVNPLIATEKCIDWLKNGAPLDENRKLGYQPEN